MEPAAEAKSVAEAEATVIRIEAEIEEKRRELSVARWALSDARAQERLGRINGL